MPPATSRFSSIVELILILLIVLPFSQALKFDLVAHSGHSSKNERCIRNFVKKDTLVVVTAIISGSRGDGQIVNMHVSGGYVAIPHLLLPKNRMKQVLTGLAMQIKDAVGNEYGRPKDVAGEKRMAFTSLADTAFDVCFENTLSGRRMHPLSPVYLLVILNRTNLTNLSAP
jgi:hypothetical protein